MKLWQPLALLACVASLAADKPKDPPSRREFYLYMNAVGRNVVDKPVIGYLMPSEPSASGETINLTQKVKQLDAQIAVAAKKLAPKENASQADRELRSEELRKAVDEMMKPLGGIKVKGPIKVIEVVKVSPTKSGTATKPSPPEAEFVLVGRIRMATGTTPEGRKELAEKLERAEQLYKSDPGTLKREKDRIRTEMEEKDERREWVGIYVFGGADLADKKRDSNFVVEGTIRSAGVFNVGKDGLDPQIEVEIQPAATK